MRQRLKRLEVIEVRVPAENGAEKRVYVTDHPQWGGAVYTEDINRAKVFRHPNLALVWIKMHPELSETARIVDPRVIKGFVGT